MSDKLPQDPLEIKHVGQAIECGTLAVLLNALAYQPIFFMLLQRVASHGAETVRQWAVHLTAQPSLKQGPVYYATFLAAEAIEVDKSVGLTYPYRFPDATALLQGNALQQEMAQCLHQLVTASPRVSNIVMPARYRLPDQWVWSARSKAEQIHLHQQHWTVSNS